jgi:hypothetical protein
LVLSAAVLPVVAGVSSGEWCRIQLRDGPWIAKGIANSDARSSAKREVKQEEVRVIAGETLAKWMASFPWAASPASCGERSASVRSVIPVA